MGYGAAEYDASTVGGYAKRRPPSADLGWIDTAMCIDPHERTILLLRARDVGENPGLRESVRVCIDILDHWYARTGRAKLASVEIGCQEITVPPVDEVARRRVPGAIARCEYGVALTRPDLKDVDALSLSRVPHAKQQRIPTRQELRRPVRLVQYVAKPSRTLDLFGRAPRCSDLPDPGNTPEMLPPKMIVSSGSQVAPVKRCSSSIVVGDPAASATLVSHPSAMKPIHRPSAE